MYVLTGGQGKGGHQTGEDNAVVLVVALASSEIKRVLESGIKDFRARREFSGYVLQEAGASSAGMPRFVEFILGVVSKTQLMATPRPYCEA